ncbi:hypothetical protein V6N12_053060 [Hibiscus sabdariffa]|uniref:Uncharacterized protein n=1 Tax=Hibiscus sabdariffa TaxID=183260 RepID=A0ABR2AX77_9ROSI
MVRLWSHNWASDISSLIHCKKANVLVDEDLLICDMVTPNDSRNRNLLHPIALSHIMSIPVPDYVASLDHCSWNKEKHGDFLVELAYFSLSQDSWDARDSSCLPLEEWLLSNLRSNQLYISYDSPMKSYVLILFMASMEEKECNHL